MTAWILSIIGVVFLGVLFDVICPGGKTNSFIKSIFSIIFMYVVMTPIIRLVSDETIELNSITKIYNSDCLEDSMVDIKDNYIVVSNNRCYTQFDMFSTGYNIISKKM